MHPVHPHKANSTACSSEVLPAYSCLLILLSFHILLIGVTLPLWVSSSEVPPIPSPIARCSPGFHLVFFRLSTAIHIIGLAWLISNLVYRLRKKDTRAPQNLFSQIRLPAGIAALGFLSCVSLNQHCLQAWAWQTALLLLCVVVSPEQSLRFLIQLSVLTIYLTSGLSRFVTTTTGSEFGIGRAVTSLFNVTGPRHATLAAQVEVWSGAFEAVTAVLLILPYRRSRQAGMLAAAMMHVGILTILGPFGRNHHAGVLVWNLMFLVLLPFLFRPDSVGNLSPRPETYRVHLGAWAGILLLTAAPVCSVFTVTDHWPSWRLYTAHPQKVVFRAAPEEVNLLPTGLQRFHESPVVFETLGVIRLDRWALAETGAPLPPDPWSKIGLAASLLNRRPMLSSAEILIGNGRDRAAPEILRGPDQIRQAALETGRWYEPPEGRAAPDAAARLRRATEH